MIGAITARDVLRHPLLIARSFGWRALWRAVRYALDGRRHTFLEAIAGARRPAW